jgi:hypothetical protein
MLIRASGSQLMPLEKIRVSGQGVAAKLHYLNAQALPGGPVGL